MGYLSKLRLPQAVALSGGYAAQVRGLSGDEEDDARTAAGAGTPQWDGKRYIREALARAVVEWTLDDDAGAVLPIDEASMRALSYADRDRLFAAMKERDGIAPLPASASTSD